MGYVLYRALVLYVPVDDWFIVVSLRIKRFLQAYPCGESEPRLGRPFCHRREGHSLGERKKQNKTLTRQLLNGLLDCSSVSTHSARLPREAEEDIWLNIDRHVVESSYQ